MARLGAHRAHSLRQNQCSCAINCFQEIAILVALCTMQLNLTKRRGS